MSSTFLGYWTGTWRQRRGCVCSRSETTKDSLRIVIVGAGLQARRRLSSFSLGGTARAACVAGRRDGPAKALADSFGVDFSLDWKKAVTGDDVDAVIICTPPTSHPEIATLAMEAGKHVLCEKPLALTIREADEMISVARRESVVLKCGLNHRYHPAIMKLKEWVDNGVLGDLYFIRARYGHAGREGYEKDWRSNPRFVAGGQLMEHGIHVLDLFRMLMGNFDSVVGFVSTSYWRIAPLEDNAMALFRNGHNQAAFLHSSLTQWRNLFSFEVGGQNALASVEGLGGSYGVEKAVLSPREFGKPFREETTEFRGTDKSWSLELEDFVNSVKTGVEPSGNGRDGLEAMRMVLAVYASAKESVPVKIAGVGQGSR